MFRQKLVRQTAVSNNSSTESSNSNTKMPSPKPLRKRWNSQDFKFNRQLSSESLDHLLIASASSNSNDETRRIDSRRHSVACGSEVQKVSLKSVLNTAMRRMSDACCLLSSAPSSTYNLSPAAKQQTVVKKEGEVVLSNALGTFRQTQQQPKPPCKDKDRNFLRSRFQNRRFSTDPPPPSYTEATNSWKQPPCPRPKFLIRQQQIVINSKGSKGSADNSDCCKREYKV